MALLYHNQNKIIMSKATKNVHILLCATVIISVAHSFLTDFCLFMRLVTFYIVLHSYELMHVYLRYIVFLLCP